MGKADRISGSFWLIFSLFISYESYQLGLGTLHQPGPGFLFFWTGLIIASLALVIIFMTTRKLLSDDTPDEAPGGAPDDAKDQIFDKRNVTKVVLVLISLFLYALLMEWLGFFVVTLLLFVFLLGAIEKKKWLFAILISVIVTALSYLLFEVGLQSQLPKGFWGQI